MVAIPGRVASGLGLLATLAAAAASALVPVACKPLLLAAGKATQGAVRKGNEMNQVAEVLEEPRSV